MNRNQSRRHYETTQYWLYISLQFHPIYNNHYLLFIFIVKSNTLSVNYIVSYWSRGLAASIRAATIDLSSRFWAKCGNTPLSLRRLPLNAFAVCGWLGCWELYCACWRQLMHQFFILIFSRLVQARLLISCWSRKELELKKPVAVPVACLPNKVWTTPL